MNSLSKIIFTLVLKLILALFLITSNSAKAQRINKSVNVNTSRGKTTITVKNGRANSFSLEFEGNITLSNDDKDITAISDGGYFEIKKSAFGSRRRIYMEPDNSGRLLKKYYVGSSNKGFDPEGKKWLAEVLPEIIRSSTIGAKQRVDRFYNQGGAAAVLDEITYIESDYVKATYLELLIEKNLTESELAAFLKTVEREIDSDHHAAEILTHSATNFLSSSALTSAYIDVTQEINSDHHKAAILNHAIENGTVSDAQIKTLFTITQDINSDHHKANVLQHVLKERNLNDSNIALLLETSKRIRSDHHKASVLKKVLTAQGLSKSNYRALIASIEDVDSDHHTASILSELLNNHLDAKSLNDLLLLSGNTINSDNHHAAVLKKVIHRQDINAANLDVFLSEMRSINSDHHKAEVFRNLARVSFNDDELIQILETIKIINSDYHQSASLLAFASKVRQGEAAVKEAYRGACNSISSESHYGKTIRVIQ